MKKIIRKLLVANRGEIAVRIMRTCRSMGISTAAVYSDVDSNSAHLAYADEKHHLGGSSARESYLNWRKIIDIAHRSGSDAIHPGYGFLSENPAFVEEVERSGLVFIGPSAAAIRRLGDKTSARAIATGIGVPVVPGTTEALASEKEAAGVASSLGYPVLLKAAAGGGGKGMRVVHDAASLGAALALSRSEAASSFSDDRVYMEKYIIDPRHIEVQILADSHGSVVHLGERECSIQRRHQKIIEESPSPAVGEALRARITESAVRLASHVGYTNAGTVEFILDRDGGYYFMEVNTRLQVEHPVTEARTGMDLVREQIRIASGEKLSVAQREISFTGHALECRIYAEDSANTFIPYTGRIGHVLHPSGNGIRVDTGVGTGSEISPYYDPMISKIIAHGASRAEAVALMAGALRSYEIYGVKTNIDLLLWILGDPGFNEGKFDTNFLGRKYSPGLFEQVPPDVTELAVLVAGRLRLDSEDRLRRARVDGDEAWRDRGDRVPG
jgi:acetyl-CoA carboxylase biotin carboxylase subunit